ncbi:putative conserved membrane protein [Synechococcus sp. RS9909]|uniref:hypothetical protein n=1 Tax=unclassified Synechococcus TaxID=2626047 RepID=UPI000068FCE2|nr:MULTISPECIES: hypothetical protein [unclassified Synechococcus]EAQ68125.1 hypothetical protein RS9917_02281 [Synechococcus sp. RS9917]QNI78716.1 putative conserved membrane protein [Synechococcus sp. RS9909]
MPWWATLIFLSLMTYLWLSGRSNPDDVIGLLEQMLSIALALVVLFIGRNLLLETLVLLFALRLPTARRGMPVIDRPQASKDVLMPF